MWSGYIYGVGMTYMQGAVVRKGACYGAAY